MKFTDIYRYYDKFYLKEKFTKPYYTTIFDIPYISIEHKDIIKYKSFDVIVAYGGKYYFLSSANYCLCKYVKIFNIYRNDKGFMKIESRIKTVKVSKCSFYRRLNEKEEREFKIKQIKQKIKKKRKLFKKQNK